MKLKYIMHKFGTNNKYDLPLQQLVSTPHQTFKGVRRREKSYIREL